MSDPFNRYPGTNADGEFPPPIRVAMARSQEVGDRVDLQLDRKIQAGQFEGFAGVIPDPDDPGVFIPVGKDDYEDVILGIVDPIRDYARIQGVPRTLMTRATSTESTPIDVPAGGNYSPIPFNTRQYATGPSMFLSGTKMTAPVSGLYRARGVIMFTAIPEKADGSRAAYIRANGTALRGGSDEKATNPIATRGTRCQVDSETFFLNEGEYIELCSYVQRATGSIGVQVTPSSSWLEMELIVARDSLDRTNNLIFNANLKDYAKSKYQLVPKVQNERRVKVANDPILGAARQVLDITTTREDDDVMYPRNQFQSPANLEENMDFWVGIGLFVPSILDFDVATDIVFHEIYGPPFGGYGPNVLRVGNNTINIRAAGSPENPTQSEFERPAWSMPTVRNKWIDILMHIKLSKDKTVGYHELKVNTGDGYVQQNFVDPATGQPFGTKRFLQTMAIQNDGGNNFASLKVAWGLANPLESARLVFAGHRVSLTEPLADPASYAARF